MGRSRFLDVLDEHAVGTQRIDKADHGASRATVWSAVDGHESVARGLGQGRRHVIDLQRQVVDALAPLGDEPADGGLVATRLEQLDGHLALTEESHAHIRVALLAAELEAQPGFEVLARLLDRPDRPSEMVDGGHASVSSTQALIDPRWPRP